ncbi:MAG: hypothetical protein LKJ88_08590 [Bacilli bacterium]|jgi:hypothetical protein|nr:hypothetical protein [Bacilli bacterium]
MPENNENNIKENQKEKPEEEKGSEEKKEVQHLVSPEVLLTALFKCSYQRGKKESWLYARAVFTRFMKAVLITFNSLAIITLILFLVGYFSWSGGMLPSDEYIMLNLVFTCLVGGGDLAFLFLILFRFLFRYHQFTSGKVQSETIYFLKDHIVWDQFERINEKELGKKETVLAYNQVLLLKETKGFLVLTIQGGNEIWAYKKGFDEKRMELDTMRGKIEEETNKKFIVVSYDYNPRYEYFLDQALKITKRNDAVRIFRFLAFFPLLPAILLNFRNGLNMDYVWVFWLSGGIGVGLLVASCALKADHHHVPKPLFVSTAWITSALIFFSLVIGILGSVYNTLTKLGKKAAIFQAETGEYFPSSGIADEENTSYVKDVIHFTVGMKSLYRDETAGTLTEEKEISQFETRLKSTESKWKSSLTDDQKDTLPSKAHLDVGDYFLLFDQTDNKFFPTAEEVKFTSSSPKDTTMYYACYDSDKKELFLVIYNFYGDNFYPYTYH